MARYKLADRPSSEIDVSDFKAKLEASHLCSLRKAYAVLLYWIGCRRSELLAFDEKRYEPKKPLRKESITEAEGSLVIANLVAKKRGWRAETIELPLSLYGMDTVKAVWQRTRAGRLLFPFSDATAYRVVKKLYPDKYPHWFRYNRTTKIRRLIDGKTFSLDDAKAFTGIKSDRTMQTYGMTTNEGAKRVGQALAKM